MEEMPIMEPPGGVWVDIWSAADWQAKNAPVRFVEMVLVRRVGEILVVVLELVVRWDGRRIYQIKTHT